MLYVIYSFACCACLDVVFGLAGSEQLSLTMTGQAPLSVIIYDQAWFLGEVLEKGNMLSGCWVLSCELLATCAEMLAPGYCAERLAIALSS